MTDSFRGVFECVYFRFTLRDLRHWIYLCSVFVCHTVIAKVYFGLIFQITRIRAPADNTVHQNESLKRYWRKNSEWPEVVVRKVFHKKAVLKSVALQFY